MSLWGEALGGIWGEGPWRGKVGVWGRRSRWGGGAVFRGPCVCWWVFNLEAGWRGDPRGRLDRGRVSDPLRKDRLCLGGDGRGASCRMVNKKTGKIEQK